MEVIEIKRDKMIFLLDREDALKYHITGTQPSMKEGYCRLITDTGMDPSFLSDVLIQIFDSKNGGCEMFVTKIQDGSDSDRKGSKKGASYIYGFECLDNMLRALSALQYMGYRSASAYRESSGGRYFLLLDKECKYLSEFMATRSKHIMPEYLSEHCSLLCHDAEDILSRFK